MPDFLGLMKQAAELKSKMETMQAELDRMEVEGTAGGGMITLKLSGKGDLRGVHVDESLLKPDQKEIVEDLIVAAHADARRKLEILLQDKMQAMTGGLRMLASRNARASDLMSTMVVSISTVTCICSRLLGSTRMSTTRPTGIPLYCTWEPLLSPATDPLKNM